MPDSKNVIWREIFGSAWNKITEFCPEMGGFLINNDSRKAFLDNNAQALSGLEGTVDYDKMLAFLDRLPEQSKNGSVLASQIISYNDNFTAGILKLSEAPEDWGHKSILPVCENSRLAMELTNYSARSVLALIEFTAAGGREPTKYQIFDALASMIKNSPKGTLASVHSANRFWLYIPNPGKSGTELLSRLMGIVGRETDGRLSFFAGIGVEKALPARRMSTAEFALYEASVKGKGGIIGYSDQQYENSKEEYEKMSRFLSLINKNLFVYHFQPIVSAKDGEIIAYEMLMRSDSSIGMYPLDILACAEKARRLYDIEKATMKNALALIAKHQDILKNRKLFVNSITAHMLTDEDWSALEEQFGELMEKMVIEFTEQTEINDEEIETIRERLGRRRIKLAIDDYGTGYSNTSNLIRYNPDYVKIDRTLIQGIHTKPKIRKLVSGIIEFIHENGYMALAEGVETYEELQAMIQLGADLIQGYYTSKPKSVMLLEISKTVRRDIESINMLNSGNISRAYHPKEDETVDLCLLSGENCNSVFVETENVTLKGRADITLETLIVIKDGIKTKIVLDGVRVRTNRDFPLIMLGERSEAELVIVGKNEFDGKGIYVPQSASLHITGSGELKVISNKSDCFAIGTDSKESPGNILIEMKSGKLYVEANGDTVTAIGGGKNENSKVIQLIGGKITIKCSGRKCTAIGIADGNSIIDIENCRCGITINSPDAVGIGSFSGAVDMQLKNFLLDVKISGINIACVGTLENGTGRIMLLKGNMNCSVNGRTANCIGTRSGNLYCHLGNCAVNLYCEGASVSGIGDIYGDGEVYIEETEMIFKFLVGEGMAYGSRNGQVKVIRCIEQIWINS